MFCKRSHDRYRSENNNNMYLISRIQQRQWFYPTPVDSNSLTECSNVRCSQFYHYNFADIDMDSSTRIFWAIMATMEACLQRFQWRAGQSPWLSFRFNDCITVNCKHTIILSPPCFMMTSSSGNIFRVTGHLCGEFTGHRWIPRTKASDAELWCFLWSVPE